jgi:XTP/dITP diphosphohydrolase
VTARALLLATANPGKLRELRELLDGLTVLGLRDVGIVDDLPETADTFLGNATQKAVEAARRSGLPCLADDSGLCVDALDGAPGVFSARFAGRHGDDEANRALLLARLADVADDLRTARFRCVLALADEAGALAGRVLHAEGECAGTITRAARGGGGFGYDPIFAPAGEARTMAELPSSVKHALSHRGAALRSMLPTLRGYLASG